MEKTIMSVSKLGLLILMMLCLGYCLSCQQQKNPSGNATPSPYPGDPMQAEIITSDISLFWEAFDLLLKDTSTNPFESHYIAKGSQGVLDFMPNKRIVNAHELKKLVLSEQNYYEQIRTSSYRAMDFEKQIRASYFALKYLYPDAVFPPSYFVIGRTTSGGTATKNGMIMGMEVYADSSFRTNYGRPTLDVNLVPFVVAHELIHFLQYDDTTNQTLLKHCIREGSADFIAELTAGSQIKLANGDNVYPYGDQHEKALWQEFKQSLDSTDLAPWLYSQTTDGRPQNLGYWMGYQIVKSFYAQAVDKKQAIRDILETKDYHTFLEKSGYRQQVE